MYLYIDTKFPCLTTQMLKAFVKYLLQEFYGMFNLCRNPIITSNIYPSYLSSKITCKKLTTIHKSYRKYHVLTCLIYNSFSMKFIVHFSFNFMNFKISVNFFQV
jgi:hypothetical protein